MVIAWRTHDFKYLTQKLMYVTLLTVQGQEPVTGFRLIVWENGGAHGQWMIIKCFYHMCNIKSKNSLSSSHQNPMFNCLNCALWDIHTYMYHTYMYMCKIGSNFFIELCLILANISAWYSMAGLSHNSINWSSVNEDYFNHFYGYKNVLIDFHLVLL